ncbi:16S rRNA (cytosine(967)-C(5))-methyltransferase RsmB [Brevibacillus humidisoli]|uniref:16S rRNA (cytosine(967)-C(5))-methyltransferase RsmB n=1 Tax=Brevibacillus humidisoli TaxID=2895522 RepID=UPI001E365217|nr:16S rRNA (cytosine(967)-C(5))-methyltransferase RsmB [Brevibacillus humidisoli]UFJ41986.1 16S rRNA (cytosine(967)-C(5))-methyltransferase RsmB [Brevibacillus humidisoli]
MRQPRSATARDVALDVLTKVDEHQSYSNLELKSALTNASLSSPDVGLVTELVYGTTQRRGTIDGVIGRLVKGGIARLQPWVRNLLRMSLYQIRYLDRVPDRAAVHEAVEIAKRRGHKGVASLVNGVLRNVLRRPEVWDEPPRRGTAAEIAWLHSHPEWLVKRWLKQFGEETTRAICESNNQPPLPSLRVNRLRMERDQLLSELQREFPEAVSSRLSKQGVVLQSGNVAKTDWFASGYCTIQDESSMLVAPALTPRPGMRVLDACAAPGGKTTHIAELMDNQGEIVACDIHPHKRQLIEQSAERLGVTIIKTLVCDAADLPEQGIGLFDRILLDAPCTGLGVIRRKPDLKWNKKPDDIADIAHLQYHLLTQVAPMLAPGGLLVYSTCTIEPEENQELVERFVAEHENFQLDHSLVEDLPESVVEHCDASSGYVQILPHQFSSDGFFISRIKRADL